MIEDNNMKNNKKLLCVLLSILFLTVPMGIVASAPTGSTTLTDSATLADEYDFVNRREPLSILVFNQYSDNAGGGEYENTMAQLKLEYGYTFEYDNLTDYTLLEEVIHDYDVFLLIEQEEASYAEMDVVADAWTSLLPGWVDDGGVLVCLDYWTAIDTWYAPTARILNNTNLMRTYNHDTRTSDPVTITNSFDPLAFGVSAFTATNGAMGFDTPDGDPIFSSVGLTVAAHRYFGFGHIVMLGFDFFTIEPNQRIILANAVRLSRLAVFDNSHAQTHDPYGGFNDFATHIQENFGFAIATMNTWDENMVQSCQVLVAGSNGLSPLPYSVNEVNLITGFVASGGGLFIMTDIWWYGNSTDPILAEFGFARNNTPQWISDSDDNEGAIGQPYYGDNNRANHSTTIGVSTIQLFGSTAFTSIPADAIPFLWTDSDGTAQWGGASDASGLTLAASLKYGAGRVVAIADGDFLSDSNNDADATNDFYDFTNAQLASSVMIWLSASGISEKTILFEQSHTPYYSVSSITTAARLLSFNGFNVRWEGHFSEQLIDEADVIVIYNGASNYTAPEIDVLREFVERGGGLFLICDWSTYYEETNEIISPFGMIVNGSSYLTDLDDGWVDPSPSSYIAYEGGNIGAHPIMAGVSRIEIDRGCGFSAIGSGTALVTTDNDGTAGWRNLTATVTGSADAVPVIVATEYDHGRVIVLPDINFLSAGDSDGDSYGTLYDSDNDVFITNAFYWLSENRAPIVEVVFPNGGELLNGTITVSWNAVDFDSDPLIFNVFYSDNNGSDWTLLVADLLVQEYAWNTTQHDDGNSYMILVEASDGQLGGQDVSDDPFELDNFVGGGPGLPIDPLLLVIIGAGVVVVLLILVILMKKKGGSKKK